MFPGYSVYVPPDYHLSMSGQSINSQLQMDVSVKRDSEGIRIRLNIEIGCGVLFRTVGNLFFSRESLSFSWTEWKI